VGVDATGDTDLSSEWAFRDDVSAGSSPSGPLGNYAIGAMGDINFGVDSFGKRDRFDTSTNLFGPPSGSLNGIDGGIVGPNVDFFSGGFTSQGPIVQNEMEFTFTISGGSLTMDEITNVQPLFGSDGAPLVPEPASLIVWSLLVLTATGTCWWRRRRKV